MTEPRCELTELLVEQCAHCRGHHGPSTDTTAEPRRYAADVDNQPVTSAVFRSRCPECGEMINPDDPITLVGGAGGCAGYWVCAECAS